MARKKKLRVVVTTSKNWDHVLDYTEKAGAKPVAGGVYDEVWAFVHEGHLSDPTLVMTVEAAHLNKLPVRWFASDGGVDIQPLPHIAPDVFPAAEDVLHSRVAAKRARTTLDDIAAKIKAGDLYEDHLEDLDALLGTELKERDREAEGQWQEWKEGEKEGSE